MTLMLLVDFDNIICVLLLNRLLWLESTDGPFKKGLGILSEKQT